MPREKTIPHPTTLRDTLHNMAEGAAAEAAYGKGVLVGVVGTLMALGWTWAEAIKAASENAPLYVAANTVPEPWLDDFKVKAAPKNVRTWERSEGRV